MTDFLRQIFSDESGNPSSNRVLGAILVLAGLVLVCVGQKEGAVVILSSGSALLGVGQIKSAIVSSVGAKPPPADKIPPKD